MRFLHRIVVELGRGKVSMSRKLILLGAAALASPGIAVGADRGITYDCDAAPGHFADLVIPAPVGPFAVTGQIKVNNIAKDKKWAPTVRIRIGSAPTEMGGAPASYAGLKLTAVPGKTVSLPYETIQMFSFDASGREAETIPSSLRQTGDTQAFRLSYDGQSVAISLGADNRSFATVAVAPVLEVVCSTGEFLITDLKIEPAG
jgi:hypothetical protein